MPYYIAKTNVLPTSVPNDSRLGQVRHLNQHFKFPGYSTLEEWESRAAHIRERILVSLGLFPMPEKTPLNAEVFGRIERDDYSIEKVHFESYPGFLCTGNLYRPLNDGPNPGVLCPHGHWAQGRLGHEAEINNSVLARMIGLARMGYVAFSWDMVGYIDSLQFPHTDDYHLAELWGIHSMGLHLWNSIRATDFIEALPDVDPNNLACTGASGGGTQTFMLTAIDERIKVSAPVNMISNHMQGGCLCENSPGLRRDIINTEIGSLMAPRPMIMVSATGDWTKNTPEEEYLDVRSTYKLYDAEDKLECVRFDAPHNYNLNSREAVYTFFSKWVSGKTGEVKEADYEVESREDLLVFPDGKLPEKFKSGDELLSDLLETRRVRASQTLKSKDELVALQKQLRIAFAHTLDVAEPTSEAVVVVKRGEVEHDDYLMEKLLLGRKGKGDQIPALFLSPVKKKSGAAGIVLVHESGKSALFNPESGEPGPELQAILSKRMYVLAIDPFLTGEFQQPGIQSGRNLASVTHWSTYNRPDHSERIQDILTAAAYLSSREEPSEVHLVGLGKAGIWGLFAKSLSTTISRAALDLNGIDTSDEKPWLDDLFIPGLLHAGGIEGACTLIAPQPLMLMNAGNIGKDRIASAYALAGKEQLLRIREDEVTPQAIANYLMSNQ
ncbi:MAG: hypothetical protein O3B01_06785 [Planctomycetota bacterium]|nr:hypothetical protein [Planctomycetota bacterium]